jgi:hypothetical protein
MHTLNPLVAGGNPCTMSKLEILAELPNLSREDRAEILDRLFVLQEAAGPTATERALLNEAQRDYDANPSAGAPWPEVESRLREGR